MDRRDKDIVPISKANELRIAVVGVGAVGRQVALQLATMGIKNVLLVDPEEVAEENVHVQGYSPKDIDKKKVEATKAICQTISGDKLDEWQVEPRRYMKSMAGKLDVVFCCVDSIDTRKFIFESCQKIQFFIDGRAGGEVVRVLSTCPDKSRDKYKETFFARSQAFQSSCTAKMTIYTANVTAGLMVAQFVKWLREMPAEGDVMINMIGMEQTVSDW